MSIPLDRLYHYVEAVAQQIYGGCVVIYRFYPHGSKNIHDLNSLRDFSVEPGPGEWYTKTTSPAMWCNDQEPLNHEFYKKNPRIHPACKIFSYTPKNLNYENNIFEKSLLLHSEKRSNDLHKHLLDGELIPVYYWSHAVIARDWFRYAQHISQKKQVKKTFLIYNRAWSGTREYRLRFIELLIQANLQECCRTTINPVEPELGIHYHMHEFINPVWKPQTALEEHFDATAASSNSSADFVLEDYEATDIEIVLETLFDDSRLHLTEKSLRPIACGQPFVLASTWGSLEYLRSYGFKTFGDVWDESYDLIEDPEQRLQAIVKLMKQLHNCTSKVWTEKMTQARAIADYNRRHFFSQEFFDQITRELQTNLTQAFSELDQCNNYEAFIQRWEQALQDTNIDYTLIPSRSKVEIVLDLAKSKLQEQKSR